MPVAGVQMTVIHKNKWNILHTVLPSVYFSPGKLFNDLGNM